MAESLFFQLRMIGEGTLTGLQREMLAMTLEANPGVALGAAVQDVFDFLEEELTDTRLEAICTRLVRENEKNQAEQPKAEAEPQAEEEGVKPTQRNQINFGRELIKWIQELHASERLLVAVGFDSALAECIYTQQDYLVTDHISTLFLQDRWQAAQIQLQAAAAPWSGGSGSGSSSNGPTEYYDMTRAAEDDPQWQELAACFGG